MTSPMISQTINRIQVSPGKNTIINKQVPIPRIGTTGTNGVLKALGASGIFFLRINTPIQTRIKANKVPILVISPTTLAGTNAANRLTKTRNKALLLEGVLNLGWTCENTLGIKPSWLMLKNTLDCPSSITRITEE